MKTTFTILPDPKMIKPPVIIRQDNVGPETPVVIVPANPDEAKDTAPPKPEKKPKPS